MPSHLQPIVAELQFHNYIALATATAVAYDYIITFPKEINYVWSRPWTFVSSMFVLVRYPGLCIAMIDAFNGTPFIPGPILANVSGVNQSFDGMPTVSLSIKGTVVLLMRVWVFIVFLAATELMMILRVHAMYNKSKIVLGVLLGLYVITIITYSVSGGYVDNPSTCLTMTIVQVLDMFYCNSIFAPKSHALSRYKLVPRLILSALMFILAVIRFCTETYQTYRLTKQWRANQYVRLLTREGVLYFLVHLLYMINVPATGPGTVPSVFATAMMFSLSPRFVISVRELYTHNLSQWDTGIDTGFGVGRASVLPSSSPESAVETGGHADTDGDIKLCPREGTSSNV